MCSSKHHHGPLDPCPPPPGRTHIHTHCIPVDSKDMHAVTAAGADTLHTTHYIPCNGLPVTAAGAGALSGAHTPRPQCDRMWWQSQQRAQPMIGATAQPFE
eukprot:scaffold298235_cov21-Tisochrysis_lutea.AAC.2